MAYTTIELAKEEYIKQFGAVKEELGYSINGEYKDFGVEITKTYERNEHHCSIEDVKLFKKGAIYHKGAKVGTYTELS